jgi:hypothetical protein
VGFGGVLIIDGPICGERTKHIDLKYHFIREQIKNSLVELKFVRSEENQADLFTKNLDSEKFNFHSKNIMAIRA